VLCLGASIERRTAEYSTENNKAHKIPFCTWRC